MLLTLGRCGHCLLHHPHQEHQVHVGPKTSSSAGPGKTKTINCPWWLSSSSSSLYAPLIASGSPSSSVGSHGRLFQLSENLDCGHLPSGGGKGDPEGPAVVLVRQRKGEGRGGLWCADRGDTEGGVRLQSRRSWPQSTHTTGTATIRHRRSSLLLFAIAWRRERERGARPPKTCRRSYPIATITVARAPRLHPTLDPLASLIPNRASAGLDRRVSDRSLG